MVITMTKAAGAVSMSEPIDSVCSRLRNGVYTITIKRKADPRTVSQNSLMWMWYKCLEDATGQDKDDWHEYYKLKFLSRTVNVNGRECRVGGSTARLTTAQMSAFLDKVQADAATEFGITLPLPADKYYAEFAETYKDT